MPERTSVPEPTAQADTASERVLVLAVDDVRDNLDVLEALLGPRVTLLRALSGTQALELLLQHDVALALVDVNMPGMDGFELAELMRGSARSRAVPIIFLTAAAPERLKVFRGYEAGAVDFLFKPIDPRLLESKVGVFIELFRQRQRLAAQVEQHRQLVRTAELLIGVLGHDLRTPLSAIATAGEALRMAYPDDARAQQLGEIIGRSSRRMSRLITQLLDFANARLGTLPVRPQPASLADLCQAAMTEFTERGCPIACETEGDVQGTWDPDRILQVLANLIANAVTHGREGGPVVVRIDGAAHDVVRIEVVNEGELPADAIATLFTPFAPSSSRAAGTGLGLFIVDQIVRAHGGSVIARAAGGQVTFVVELPRRSAATPPASPALSTTGRPDP
jgi:signal transduction histidine kinase